MSQRIAGSQGKSGTRSSSSSSSSSSSTSSSSSSSRFHNRRDDRSRSHSRSRISSGSSRSLSRSRTRSRSGDRHHKRRRSREDRRDLETGRRSNQELEHDDSSSDHLIDDSIRSDKSSKSSSNGGYGETASSQRDSLKATAPAAVPAKTSTRAAGIKSLAQPMEHDPPQQAPPPPRISKTAIQFGKPGTVARPGIHMKLAQTKAQPEQPKRITVASAFNNDSDDEVEEMPPECKMRMRNIGRDTPTSSGPNSFGKTKQGFIDSKKLFEKSLREAAME